MSGVHWGISGNTLSVANRKWELPDRGKKAQLVKFLFDRPRTTDEILTEMYGQRTNRDSAMKCFGKLIGNTRRSMRDALGDEYHWIQYDREGGTYRLVGDPVEVPHE